MKKKIANLIVEDPHKQSHAALIKLCKKLGRKSEADWKAWLRFRKQYLTEIKKKNGELICVYCGKKDLIIDADNKHPLVATIDHIVPKARGGARYDRRNLTVACNHCNGKKADKSLEELKICNLINA